MDIIHAFNDYEKSDLYEKVSQISNAVQASIDANGMADFMLIILQKQ